LILFGKKVEEIYPHTIFKVEINYGNQETEIKDFGGPIVNQLTPILDFIKDKALRLTIDRTKGQREEKSDFPIGVLREVIANAIVHRDYENEKSTNYISISPDKIIVRSPGNLESPLTIKDLETFDAPSISRNPKIMFVFNKMGLAEQRGIGLKNMGQLSPKPSFDLKAGMLQVTIGRTKDFIAESKGFDSSLLSYEDKNGLLFIEQNSLITVNDYAKEFGLSAKVAQRRLADLIEKGIIERIGERRWAKYKLTEKPD
jgi:ATP-dependent DNA helicase RecG